MSPRQLAKLSMAVGACAVFTSHTFISGATRSWTGAAGGSKAFDNPGNWSPAIVPSGSDFAFFPINDTVLLTATRSTGEVNIAHSSITANESAANTIWAIGGAGGGFRVEGTSTFTINGLDLWTPGLNVHEQGTMIINSGSDVRVQQGITTDVGVAVSTTGTSGNIFVNSGGTLTAFSASIGSQGGFGLGGYTNGQLIINGGVGSIDTVLLADVDSGLSNAWMTVMGGGSMNQPAGLLSVASGAGAGVASLAITGAGSVYRHAGSGVLVGSATSTGRVFVTNSGSFNIVSGGMSISKISAVAIDGGLLASPGITVSGTLSFSNNGGTIIISPGQSLSVTSGGAFLAAGNYSLSPGSRLSISTGIGSFGGALNVGTANSATLSVGAAGTLNANNLSTLGSGTLGNATATFLGTENFTGGLNIGAAGAAATIAVNGGTMNIDGSSGLTIGDATGAAAAKLVVSGASSRITMGNFAPVAVNKRGNFQLLSGGILNTTNLTVDGGMFDATAGSLSILPFSMFSATLSVQNNGTFYGTDLNLSPAVVRINSGLAKLSGGLVITRGSMDVTGANALIQAGTALLIRSTSTLSNGGVASFGGTSLPFNPFGTATLSINPGGVLRTGSLDIGTSGIVFLKGGTGSISGDLTNASTFSITSGVLTVDGSTTNTGTMQLLTSGISPILATFGNIDGSGRTVIDGASTMTFNHLRQSLVTLQGEAFLKTRTDGGNAGISHIGAFDFGSSESDTHWDLTNNALIIDTTKAGYIRALVEIGRDDGKWGGGGISSSSAAADPSHRALGYGANSVLGYSFFGSEPVTASAVFVKFTWLGDGNLDGRVDIKDLYLLASHFNSSATVWTGGDFNYDGQTDVKDLTLLARNWQAGTPGNPGLSLGSALASLGLPMANVPEPAAVLPSVAAMAALSHRSRRKLSRSAIHGRL